MSAYRASMARRGLARAAGRGLAQRSTLLAAAAAAGLLLVPTGVLRDDVAGGPSHAAAAAPPPAPGPAVPRIVSHTLAEGSAGYAGGLSSSGREVRFEQAAFRTIEDAWSAAFFGDRQRMGEFIERSAGANDLPVEFLTRLLTQESGLNHRAVSRAGAQGVAQFMPATAGERGLVDPFDPFEAIPKSAELLREHRARFGSLGLAAAAYNAGPRRVRDWLEGRAPLPKETRDYVARITGRTADDWRQSGDAYAFAAPVPTR
ncbi:lytic transglycosylase domain-containing protein [Methylobacterium crusticola]|uniref:lytic transglycosylase domain-containing protein n=1 Tax=Methylobacterium crusticola TaxID=1697972 RepID=UPI001FD55FE2|nr:lytic transglycosylase domain-containing protein [Methylobacterium crusticola]